MNTGVALVTETRKSLPVGAVVFLSTDELRGLGATTRVPEPWSIDAVGNKGARPWVVVVVDDTGIGLMPCSTSPRPERVTIASVEKYGRGWAQRPTHVLVEQLWRLPLEAAPALVDLRERSRPCGVLRGALRRLLAFVVGEPGAANDNDV